MPPPAAPPPPDGPRETTADGARDGASDAREAASDARERVDDRAPGLREQVGRTRDAVMGLLRAHLDLARAEFDEIKGEVARVAALGGAALGCLVLLGLLLPIGLILFVGEWLFGSIGWGVLHGSVGLVAVALAAVLAALRIPRLGAAFGLAILVGVGVALLLGPSLPNQAWTAIGDATALPVDPGIRPLVVGTVVGALAGLVIGLLAGARSGATGAGLVGGLVIGLLLGAFSAIDFGWRVGIAVGVFAGLTAWIALMAVAAVRSGVDGEALKARFWPQVTIDTTKETIEWAKARSPRAPRS